MRCTPDRFEDFIHANTAFSAPPHVPEVGLHLADEAHELWHRTEEELAEIGLPPPFWAFAWAGGQGLARYVFDQMKAALKAGKLGADSEGVSKIRVTMHESHVARGWYEAAV